MRPSGHITQVVKGKVGISPEVAVSFERVTSIPTRYWIQLDANHQAALHRQAETQVLEERVDLVDRFPVRDLMRRQRIRPTDSKVDALRELLRFFAVADPDALEEVCEPPRVSCRLDRLSQGLVV